MPHNTGSIRTCSRYNWKTASARSDGGADERLPCEAQLLSGYGAALHNKLGYPRCCHSAPHLKLAAANAMRDSREPRGEAPQPRVSCLHAGQIAQETVSAVCSRDGGRGGGLTSMSGGCVGAGQVPQKRARRNHRSRRICLSTKPCANTAWSVGRATSPNERAVRKGVEEFELARAPARGLQRGFGGEAAAECPPATPQMY
jgi:hypothetical protein